MCNHKFTEVALLPYLIGALSIIIVEFIILFFIANG